MISRLDGPGPMCFRVCYVAGSTGSGLRLASLRRETHGSKKKNSPGGVFLLGCFQTKKLEKEDPPLRTTTKIDQFWWLFFRGGPLLPGSWFRNHSIKETPLGGGVSFDQLGPRSRPLWVDSLCFGFFIFFGSRGFQKKESGTSFYLP